MASVKFWNCVFNAVSVTEELCAPLILCGLLGLLKCTHTNYVMQIHSDDKKKIKILAL
jgi:hypothetical protein